MRERNEKTRALLSRMCKKYVGMIPNFFQEDRLISCAIECKLHSSLTIGQIVDKL
jgi:hypothetical protein